MDMHNLGDAAKPRKKIVALKGAEEGSQMQREFQRDQELADKYLDEANAKDLYELYQHRCKQLNDFGGTLATMAEMYAGKNGRHNDFDFAHSPDAVKAMERVAIAAIELAKAVASKSK